MDETYVTRLIDSMEAFMPTVRKMRLDKPWPEVAAAVTRATGTTWTIKRLRQSVRRLIAEGLVDRTIMGRSARPRRRRSDELAVLVQGIALANPEMSLRAIGGQLEAMKLKTPAGKAAGSPTSVSHLLNRQPPGAREP
jgi:hypothetical protein